MKKIALYLNQPIAIIATKRCVVQLYLNLHHYLCRRVFFKIANVFFFVHILHLFRYCLSLKKGSIFIFEFLCQNMFCAKFGYKLKDVFNVCTQFDFYIPYKKNADLLIDWLIDWLDSVLRRIGNISAIERRMLL